MSSFAYLEDILTIFRYDFRCLHPRGDFVPGPTVVLPQQDIPAHPLPQFQPSEVFCELSLSLT